MYLIVSTEQAETLVSHSLSDLSFGSVTSWGDFCSVPHTLDANSVTWPRNTMEHPLYRQVLAIMTILLSHNIYHTNSVCQVRMIHFMCSCHTNTMFFGVKIFIVFKCLHFYISYLCAKFRHSTLYDTNIASTSEVCTVFRLILWVVGG
jgi:hypothetical protein